MKITVEANLKVQLMATYFPGKRSRKIWAGEMKVLVQD
jgi:hypothetical protein